jgi:hypothetical protein
VLKTFMKAKCNTQNTAKPIMMYLLVFIEVS